MRTAILSDIHGNLTAFEAVLADIRMTSPDLVLHGGDLADQGSGPLEVIDSIRSLGWQGVMGNTDAMLVRPDSLEEFASQSKAPADLWTAIRQMAASSRDRLGNERLEWLRALPLTHMHETFGLVHASPGNCWLAPHDGASETELEEVYGSLDRPVVVFGHTHRPFIQRLGSRIELLINSGSVGLPYDGDPRASYLLIDSGTPSIRRVAYDVETEIAALERARSPGWEWTAKMLRASAPQMP